MKRIICFYLLVFCIAQPSLSQSKLKHSIYGEGGGATFLYGVGYEIGWFNREKVSLQSSLGYGYYRLHNINFRTDVSFLKSNHFQFNFGPGYSYSWGSGSTKFLNLHLGFELLFFNRKLSLHPYFMSGLSWEKFQASGSSVIQSDYIPFWGGFRLKYTFARKDKES